jgi:glutamyl-tRNA reductase
VVLRAQLESLKETFGLNELLYLSTCNRVMYLFDKEEDPDDQFITDFFRFINPDLSANIIRDIDKCVSYLEGDAALEHLFEVAASIDSLVIGERQILGQLREAYDQSQAWGLTGDHIRLLFQHAVLAAKAVYAQTRIGDKPVSIVSLAIQKLLRAKLPKDAPILIVGAGQTNQLVAKFLQKHQFSRVAVFNRTLAKARKLADSFDGEAFTLAELPEYDRPFECLIVCTGSTDAVITPALYRQLLRGDERQKILIDLSVPHNVDRAVADQFPVNYIEIEGLRQLAKENLSFREQEVCSAKKILQQHVEAFPVHFRQRQLERAMQQVPTEIKAVKSRAMNEVFHKEVAQLDEETRLLLERMLTYMEKKCISIPMKAAREMML